RLVREDVDPHLAAPADVAGDRPPGRLDLPTRDPAGPQREQPVVAAVDLGAAPGLAAHTAALPLAGANLLRSGPPAPPPPAAAAAGAVARGGPVSGPAACARAASGCAVPGCAVSGCAVSGCAVSLGSGVSPGGSSDDRSGSGSSTSASSFTSVINAPVDAP